ncbi:hypothetical protein KP79_PYT21229 [Mizuhopecten yessoensis]|uniref:Uncharacterized protein n=1 Tax=Mizuhopecten yessoensis TaxID=6573 RepID=A0A210QDA7_MIZYE|nr:hypothetical protein KP79_PYT21229 [Mizuhopecten yessoensis]
MTVLLVLGLTFSLTNVEGASSTTVGTGGGSSHTNSTSAKATTAPKHNSAMSLYATSFIHFIPLILGYRLLN